jgi:hypothetical protein
MSNYFAENLSKLEPNLLLCGNYSSNGIEYPLFNNDGTVFSFLDIFAADCKGGLVAIECKLQSATYSTVGQIAAYYSALRELFPKGQAHLRIFVLCHRTTMQFWYALRQLKDVKVQVFTYKDDLTVTPCKPPPRKRNRIKLY